MPRPRLELRTLAPMAAGECALMLLAWGGVHVANNLRVAAPGQPYTDFQTLLLAGRMAREGRLADVYRWDTFAPVGHLWGMPAAGYSPFSYPPPFALAMGGLAGLPLWAAYACFAAVGAALLLFALRFAAPNQFWPLVLAVSPAAFPNITGGQNGMLTAGLAGLSLALALRGGSGAGGALAGLLGALKPHMALGLPLAFALRRDGRALAAAAAAGAALVGLAALALGTAVLPAFLGGLSETAAALAQGRFPFERMTSVYAFLRTAGVPAAPALAAHAVAALAVSTVAASAARRHGEPRAAAGLCVMATAFFSPYFYDYDGCIVAAGLAFALPAIWGARGARAAALPLAGLALGSGVSVLQAILLDTKLSLGAPPMLLCFLSTAALMSPRTGERRRGWPRISMSTGRAVGRPG